MNGFDQRAVTETGREGRYNKNRKYALFNRETRPWPILYTIRECEEGFTLINAAVGSQR